jgi:transcriptional regulator with XRE-family HTH domain
LKKEEERIMGFDVAEFGRFIKDVRESERISAQELAALAGISTTQNITRIERGVVTNPTYDTVERVMKAINKLNIIIQKEFKFDGYSQSLKDTLNRFCDNGENITVDKPQAVVKIPEDLMNASQVDMETACAIIAVIHEYPIFRDALNKLCNKVKDNFDSSPERIDYADMINDMTKRVYTQFYFNLNDKIGKFVKTGCYTNAYDFMTMLIHALSENIENYADKDNKDLSAGTRQLRAIRRRHNNSGY